MATRHLVQQGEHLSQLAGLYGFRSYKPIWNHPENAELRRVRPNPNVLLPGDQVYIPDKSQKVEACPTDRSHSFKLAKGQLRLRLVLRDFDNKELTNLQCEIKVDGVSTSLTTDARGRVEVPISPTAKEATLVFKDPLLPFNLSVPIKIGFLDPVTEISGQQGRLSNLGYIASPLEEVDDTIFAHAVQEFQCDLGLPVTGVCDGATQAKLKEIHGS